jgi:DNA-binding MarR family transcriptional regulator
VLTELVMTTFRLNGAFLEAAEAISRPVGLTAAWWQVLGAVLSRPAPVAAIARDMGLARQSVQRIADLLVDRGLAEYLPNPQHKRAQLLQPTPDGRRAIAELADAQHQWANRISVGVGEAELRRTLRGVSRIVDTLGADAASGHT